MTRTSSTSPASNLVAPVAFGFAAVGSSALRPSGSLGVAVLAFAVALLAVTPARAQVIYQYTQQLYGDSIGRPTFKAVNDAGQVVGMAWVVGPGPFGGVPVPFRSSPSLPPPPTTPSAGPASGIANDINSRGQVAATVTTTSVDTAFRYTDGAGWQSLGAGPRSAANGINDMGQVVGVNSLGHAFLFTDSIGIRDLGVPQGFTSSVGIAINNAGQVAINATNSQGASRAFRYTDGVGFQDLGTPTGFSSTVAGINSRGQLAVNVALPSGGSHGYRYTDGVGLEDLGLGGPVTGISAIGVLTGHGPSEHRDGIGWRNLNSLVPPVPPYGPYMSKIGTAVDISDGGTILGLDFGPIGITFVYVLTPVGVPEPSALALLGLAAAGGLAVRIRRRLMARRVLPFVLLVVLAAPAAAPAQVIYTVTDLGVLPGATSATPGSINDRGQVAGTSGNRAFRYTPGVGMVSLGVLPGDTSSGATGINNAGQVTGASQGPPPLPGLPPTSRAFRYTDGVGMVALPSSNAFGIGINDGGQVTGWLSGGLDSRMVFRYSDGLGMVTLGHPPGISTQAEGRAINNNGQIAGNYSINHFPYYFGAFRYSDGLGFVDLSGGIGTANATAINASGDVTGTLGSFAFLYRDGVGMTSLGTLTGYAQSDGEGINDRGEVIGVLGQPARAMFWSNATGMLDLNSRIDPSAGWVLGIAYDINNVGQIVGVGRHNGVTGAFLLTPIAVPEPSALAFVGLAAVCRFVLRRIRRTANPSVSPSVDRTT